MFASILLAESAAARVPVVFLRLVRNRNKTSSTSTSSCYGLIVMRQAFI